MTQKAIYRITGMTCTSCSSTIEKHLRSLPGVTSVQISLMLNEATIVIDDSKINLDDVRTAVENVGFDAELLSHAQEPENVKSGAGSLQLMLETRDSVSTDKLLDALGMIPGFREASFVDGQRIRIECDASSRAEIEQCINQFTGKQNQPAATQVEKPSHASTPSDATVWFLLRDASPETVKKIAASIEDNFPSAKCTIYPLATHKGQTSPPAHLKVHVDAHLVGGRCVLNHIQAAMSSHALTGSVRVVDDPQSQQTCCNSELARCRRAALKCLVPGIMIFLLTMTPHEKLPPFLLFEFLPGISLCGILMVVLATPIQWWWGAEIHARAWKNLKLRHITMDTFISFNTSFCYVFSVLLMLMAIVNTLALDGFTSAHLHSGDLTHASYLTPTINWVSLGNISIPFPSPPANVSLSDLLMKVHSEENIRNGYVGLDSGYENIPAWKASLIDSGDLHTGGGETPHYFETAALLITVVLWGKTFELSAKQRTLSALQELHRIKDTTATVICAAQKERDDSTSDGSSHESSEGLYKPRWVSTSDPALPSLVLAAHRQLEKSEGPQCCGENDTIKLDVEAASREEAIADDWKTQTKRPRGEWSLQVMQFPAVLLHIGDLAAVAEGERVPADGIIICNGDAHLDESMISGESLPVAKREGDRVLEGSVNCGPQFWMVVHGTGNGTVLGQVISTVRSASACESPSGIVADRISSFFLPIALVLAVIAWTVWGVLVATGRVVVPLSSEHMMLVPSYFHFAHKIMFVMKFGISVLAIACPCALGLATPTAMAVATGQAVKMGILVKNGSALEKGSTASVIVMDKTGTLTAGKPVLQSHIMDAKALSLLVGNLRSVARRVDTKHDIGDILESSHAMDRDTHHQLSALLWCILSSLEQKTKHPIGQAIVAFARSDACAASVIEKSPLIVEDVETLGGRGISGLLRDASGQSMSSRLTIGSQAFYETVAHDNNRVSVFAQPGLLKEWLLKDPCCTTVVLFGQSGIFYAALRLRDAVVAESPAAVRYLQNELSMDVYMCTGDHGAVAQDIAAAVGIAESHVVSEATPWAKATFVESIRSKNKGKRRRVVMLGDGSNDSLALVNADVGVSIGADAEIMAVAADVVLIKHDLSAFLSFLELSKRTRSTITRNFAWAFLFNIIGLPAAAGAFYPHVEISPLFAGTAMAMSSVLVIINSLSLFRVKPVQLKVASEFSTAASTVIHAQIEMVEDPRMPLVPRQHRRLEV